MEGLKETVRHLVALILAAGALEMVLPQGNLRGYVRVVLGLAIMLTILTPLLGWRQPVTLDPAAIPELAEGRLPSLAEVSAAAARLRSAGTAAAVREFRASIRREAEQLALQVPGVAAAAAEVNTGEPAGSQPPPVTLVRVRITPGRGGAPGAAAGEGQPPDSGEGMAPASGGGVAPVTPVERVPATPVGAAPATENDAALVAAVRRRVAEGLRIGADRVLVAIKR